MLRNALSVLLGALLSAFIFILLFIVVWFTPYGPIWKILNYSVQVANEGHYSIRHTFSLLDYYVIFMSYIVLPIHAIAVGIFLDKITKKDISWVLASIAVVPVCIFVCSCLIAWSVRTVIGVLITVLAAIAGGKVSEIEGSQSKMG